MKFYVDKLPETCKNCDCMDLDAKTMKCFCRLDGLTITDGKEKRLDSCPLEELDISHIAALVLQVLSDDTKEEPQDGYHINEYGQLVPNDDLNDYDSDYDQNDNYQSIINGGYYGRT